MSGKKRGADADMAASGAGADAAHNEKRQRRPSSRIVDYNDAEIDALIKQAEEDTGKRGKKGARGGKDDKSGAAGEAGSHGSDAAATSGQSSASSSIQITLTDMVHYQQLMQYFTALHTATQQAVAQAKDVAACAVTAAPAASLHTLVTYALILMQQLQTTPQWAEALKELTAFQHAQVAAQAASSGSSGSASGVCGGEGGGHEGGAKGKGGE